MALTTFSYSYTFSKQDHTVQEEGRPFAKPTQKSDTDGRLTTVPRI